MNSTKLKLFLLNKHWAIGCIVVSSCLASAASQESDSNLSLIPIVNTALKRSLNLLTQKNQEEQAQLAKKDSLAGFFPSLSLAAGRTWTTSQSESNQQVSTSHSAANSMGIYGSWTLWDHASTWHQYQTSRINQTVAQLETKKETQSLIVQVIDGYLTHLLNIRKADLAQKYLDQSQLTLEESKVLLRAGAITAIEAMDSEIQVVNAERDDLESKLELENSERSFRALLNLSPEDAIANLPLLEIKPYFKDRFQNALQNIESIGSAKAHENSWEDQIAQNNLERAKISHRQTQWDYWPKLSLSLSKTWDLEQRVNPDEDGFRPILESSSIGLSLSWTLWDWFSSRRNVQSSSLGLQSTNYEYLDQRRKSEADIKNLLSQYRILLKSVESSGLSLEKSKKQMENSRELHKLGRINLLLMQQSTNRYFESESAYAERLKSLYLAMAKILYVTGYDLTP